MEERIKELRLALGITQQVFAGKLNPSRSNIANYEAKKNSPSDGMVSLICREFNVNEEWLRTGQGEMFKQLTNQEELMKYTALLLKDNKSAIASAIQALIVTYEQLDDSNKDVLEKVALKYIENLKKSR